MQATIARRLCALAMIGSAALIPGWSAADICTWVGGVDTNWSTDANWDVAHAPASGDSVVIASTNPYSPYCTITAGSTVTVVSVDLGLGATNVTLTLAGLGILATTGDFRIGAKGTLTQADNPTNAAVAQHKLNVACVNFTMDGGSWVNADNRGFKGTNGPAGAPNRASNGVAGGGSYGGLGGGTTGRKGDDSLDTYGSPFQPTDLGCGSANPTNSSGVGVGGGGAVHVSASGTATLNGTITARGTNTLFGGGSGGSIWVEAATMTGSGTNRADGANFVNSNGGGGGGRIAFAYGTASSFSPFISATPGTSVTGVFHPAELGTLSVPAGFFPANLVVTQTLYALAPGNYAFNSLTISNATFEICAGSGTVSTLTVTNNLIVTNAAALLLRGNRQTTFGTGCSILANNISVSANSSINADGKGFRNGQGPGNLVTGATMRPGGSHGGDGGPVFNVSPHGLCYGSLTQPTALGSSGGGYTGYGLGATANSVAGGAIQFTVNNTFTLNGRCSADGLNGCWGGGSGGSLWIAVTNLVGTGTFSAQGGNCSGGDAGYAGAGGGGRIAIYAGTRTGFTGAMLVDGAAGNGVPRGRPGTLYLPEFYTAPGIVWTVSTNMALAAGTNYFDNLIITNGAFLDCQGNQGVRGDSPSALTNYGMGVTIVARSVTVASNSFIYADAQGFCASNGPGHGVQGGYNNIYNSGGTHGGFGGSSTLYAGQVSTNNTYGSSNQPAALGSGAGATVSNNYSHGGGAIRLVCAKDITINGTITANGVDGGGIYTSGGSGGSIWLTALRFYGQGIIQANGGTNSTGCGGGGGRIAVHYTYPTASFPTGGAGSLTLSVAPNQGSALSSTTNGFAGTIYSLKLAPSGTAVIFR